MTLLEVILSIAILGGSLAVLGELARVGTRAARTAQVLSTAHMLCDSIAAEITAGVSLPESTEGVVNDYGGMQWSYMVQVEQADQEGLLAVLVTVQEAAVGAQRPVSFSLVRWMIDPQLEMDLEAAEEQLAAESAASSSGTSGTQDTSAAAEGSEAAGGGR